MRLTNSQSIECSTLIFTVLHMVSTNGIVVTVLLFNLLHTFYLGCRSSSFSLEAKSIATWKTSRHCVLTRLKDLTNIRFSDIVQQAGALLVMLPKDMTSLSNDERMVRNFCPKYSPDPYEIFLD